MTFKVSDRLPDFNGVAVNSRATLLVPTGNTIHNLSFAITSTEVADVDTLVKSVRLSVQGEVIIDLTAAEWRALNGFYGVPHPSGNTGVGVPEVYNLNFDRQFLRLEGGVELTAIGTGLPANNTAGQLFNPVPINNIQVELELGAAADPSIDGYVLQSFPRPTGIIQKIRRFTYSALGANSDRQITDLTLGDDIQAIFVNVGDTDAGSNLAEVELQRQSQIIFKRPPAINNFENTKGGFVNQPGWFVINPLEQKNATDVLITAGTTDFRLNIRSGISAAQAITVLVVYNGGL